MSCPQTLAGIAKDCSANMGGIVRVLLANKDDVTATTITDGEITAVTMASGAKFKEYLFRPNTGNMVSEYQIDDAAGTKFVQTTLAMVFSRMETAKRLEISAIALADAVAIVEDANGKFWYLGYDFPLTMSAGGGDTGTARADRNGYTLSLMDNSKELPMEVSASIIDGLLD